MSQNSSLDNFKYSFDNVQSLVQFADTKANALLGIHTLIITLFTGAMLVENLRKVVTEPSKLNEWVITLSFILGGLLLLISAYTSIMVIIPREAKDVGAKKRSLFYYKHVAAFENPKEFYDNFENSSDKNITMDIAHQAHVVSRIVDKKFRTVRLSLYFTNGYLIAFVLGAMTLILTG